MDGSRNPGTEETLVITRRIRGHPRLAFSSMIQIDSWLEEQQRQSCRSQWAVQPSAGGVRQRHLTFPADVKEAEADDPPDGSELKRDAFCARS